MLDRSTWGPQGIPAQNGYLGLPAVDERVLTPTIKALAGRYRELHRDWVAEVNLALDLKDEGYDVEARRQDIAAAVAATDKNGNMPDVGVKHRQDLATRRQQASDKSDALEQAIENARLELDDACRKRGADPKVAELVTTARAEAVQALKEAAERLDSYLSLEASELWLRGPGDPPRLWNVISQTGGPQHVSALLTDLTESISPTPKEQ